MTLLVHARLYIVTRQMCLIKLNIQCPTSRTIRADIPRRTHRILSGRQKHPLPRPRSNPPPPSTSSNTIAHPRGAFVPRNLLNIRLPTQLGRRHMRPTTRIHLTPLNPNDSVSTLFIRHGFIRFIADTIRVKLIPRPEFHNHRHVFGDILVDFFLYRYLVFAVDEATELTRCADGVM